MHKINKYIRRQRIDLIDFAPNHSNRCACGCGIELIGKKKRWASPECADRVYALFSIIKGNSAAIRKALFTMDKGFCRHCGVYDDGWVADHIIPVAQGGGGCDISNFQTLCPMCHSEKTRIQMVAHRADISSQDASSAPRFRL
jgi:5-methylcytosine-specific restriction endonuclease McrA